MAEGPASTDLLKAPRPGKDARKDAPYRRQLAGPFLDQLFGATEWQSCQSLSLWYARVEADLIFDT